MICNKCGKKEASNNRGGQHLCWKCKKLGSGGNISFLFTFLVFAFVIMFGFVFISPALQTYTTKIYAVAEPLLDDANATTVNDISDAGIKKEIQDTLQASKDTTATQIGALNFFYQYAWIFVLAIISFILVIYSRFLVERQQGAV